MHYLDILMSEFDLHRNSSPDDVTRKLSGYINDGSRASLRKAIRLGHEWRYNVNPQAAESASAHFYFQLGLAHLLYGELETAVDLFLTAGEQPGFNGKMRGDIQRDLAMYYVRKRAYGHTPWMQRKAKEHLRRAWQAHAGDQASRLIDRATEARAIAAEGKLRIARAMLGDVRREYLGLQERDEQHFRNVTFQLMVIHLRLHEFSEASSLAKHILSDTGEHSRKRKRTARAVVWLVAGLRGTTIRRWHLGRM